MFILNSAGLIDTGSNVSLIDVNILPKRFANRLTPNGNPVNGIGGATKVLGIVMGKCSIGDADFVNVEFQVVEKLPSSARIIIGTNVLLHQDVSKISIDRVAKCLTFEFKGQNDDSAPILKTSKYYDDIMCVDTLVTCHGTQQEENKENKEKKNAKTEIPRFKTLREKLEYLKKEHDIPLYHSNKDYLEKFADMIIANLSVFGDGELGAPSHFTFPQKPQDEISQASHFTPSRNAPSHFTPSHFTFPQKPQDEISQDKSFERLVYPNNRSSMEHTGTKFKNNCLFKKY